MTASRGAVLHTLCILVLMSQLGSCTEVAPSGVPSSTADYTDPWSDNSETVDYSDFVQQCQKEDVRSFRRTFLPAVYTLVCLLGLLGNGLVVLTYLYYKRLRTMTDVYLLNLALADLLFLLTLPFWAVSVVRQWLFGRAMCKAVHGLYRLSFISGMLLLMCISIDRYFSIVRAASAHRLRSRAVYCSKLVSVGVWLFSAVFSVPELIYSDEQTVEDTVRCRMNQDNTTFIYTTSLQLSFGFLLPLLVMTFCYCVVVRTLLLARNFEKNKAIKVIIAVVLVFLLFQLPYNSVLLIDTIADVNATVTDCALSKRMTMALDISKSLAYVRCCLNPFLYAFIGVKFRNDLLKLLKELGCVSSEKLLKLATMRPTASGVRTTVVTDTDSTTTYSP
ncbi:C-C chemokine receptor type 7 [Pristis pectinata]|uniref:C-C chemokine receptor type 7 n=1 Tax=Pristis pectinata TaxID=685728 RepID=UPI00223E6011|nr:C-C chemokine receptor type 7 [Pristis pectinata]